MALHNPAQYIMRSLVDETVGTRAVKLPVLVKSLCSLQSVVLWHVLIVPTKCRLPAFHIDFLHLEHFVIASATEDGGRHG